MTNCTTTYFKSYTGECNIAVHTWLPEGEIKGVIQLAHGMSEYVKRFEKVAKFFNEQGYVFCGNDHAGHGESLKDEAHKGYFAAQDGWTKIVLDVMEVHRRLKEKYPKVKHILYGHSMGSFIARTCASRFPAEFDAFIWSGTVGRLKKLPFGRLLVRLEMRYKGSMAFSKLINKLTFAPFVFSVKNHRTNFDWLCCDNDVVDKYVADPLCGFSFRLAAYRDMFDGISQISTRKWAKSVADVPIYLLSGAHDPVGNMGKGVRQVCNMLIREGKSNVVMQIYADGRHEMHNENNSDEVFRGIAAFIRGI